MPLHAFTCAERALIRRNREEVHRRNGLRHPSIAAGLSTDDQLWVGRRFADRVDDPQHLHVKWLFPSCRQPGIGKFDDGIRLRESGCGAEPKMRPLPLPSRPLSMVIQDKDFASVSLDRQWHSSASPHRSELRSTHDFLATKTSTFPLVWSKPRIILKSVYPSRDCGSQW